MRMTMKIYQLRLRHFLASTRGSMSMEAVIMLPLLAWAYVGMFTFFDAFRTRNTAEKAVYTVSDAITRVADGVDEDYLDGMKTLYDYLTFSAAPTTLRFSEVQWREDDPLDDENENGAYYVTWSYGTNDQPSLTNAELAEMTDRIPKLNNGERLILVESDAKWNPVFNVGLPARSFDFFVPTSPRFATQVAWEGASVYLGEDTTNIDETNADDEETAEDDEDTNHARRKRKWWW